MTGSLTSLRRTALITLCAMCGACSEPEQPEQKRTPAEPTAASPEDPILSGFDVYRDHCASCHDSGLGGAPVTGNAADWKNRSGLWVAVLAEHVKAGYLQMPARGGVSPLSDLSVTQAVEYMMLQTFPEKPAD